jgi:hypothetical protein
MFKKKSEDKQKKPAKNREEKECRILIYQSRIRRDNRVSTAEKTQDKHSPPICILQDIHQKFNFYCE